MDPGRIAAETAKNAATVPLRIWYRSSQGCPEGPAFVTRLSELGRRAALAGVGDHVDFVVTLAMHGEQSAGRLERATERGTVAIRELSAPTCDEVAEGLALTLELTLAPAAEPEIATTAQPGSVATASPRERPPSTEARDGGPAPSLPPAEDRGGRVKLELGAHAGAVSGLSPGVALGGNVFVALGNPLRLSALGAYGRGDGVVDGDSEARSTTLGVGLVGARLDSCPLGYRSDRFELHPCLGLELGLLWARSRGARAQTDEGFWSGAAGLVRGGLRVSRSLWTELELGVRVPFVRYTLTTTSGAELFRTSGLGTELALGIRFDP